MDRPQSDLGDLLGLDREARRFELESSPEGRVDVVVRLSDETVRLSRVDPALAQEVAEDACWLAERTEDAYCQGRATRALGHAHLIHGRHADALGCYDRAIGLFESDGHRLEVGITLNSTLGPLSYLGRYEEAVRRGERATEIFAAEDEVRRLTQLTINLANIHFRQDRFGEALELYLEAMRDAESGSHDMGIVLRNVLVCQISLGELDAAEASYRRAKRYCLDNDLPRLVTECDYNVAYLHYLRGDYSRALRLYDEARAACREAGDRYHLALSDLDQAEIYLELNLFREGGELADAARSEFEQLSMGYEVAKALTLLGAASNRARRNREALDHLARARALFVEENNRAWAAQVDLYRAGFLLDENRDDEARRLVRSARRFFADSPFVAKAVLCDLALVELDLRRGRAGAAADRCRGALERVDGTVSPIVAFQAEYLLGDALLADSDHRGAAAAYGRASAILERLRAGLEVSAFRISFLKERVGVYDRLFWLSAEGGEGDTRSALEHAERAKSRHLLELVSSAGGGARRGDRHPPEGGVEGGGDPPVSEVDRQIDVLQRQLGSLYRMVSQDELEGGPAATARRRSLARRVAEVEAELDRQMRGREPRSPLQLAAAGQPVDVDSVCSVLGAGRTLVEYFASRGRFYALTLSRRGLSIERLAAVDEVLDSIRLLRFQLAKHRLGGKYMQEFSGLVSRSILNHLGGLHDRLLGPLVDRLEGEHLVIVPHGELHYVPFHALTGRDGYLIERYAVSYAPSASVYYRCCAQQPVQGDGSLVLAVSDQRAPEILSEAREIAATLGDALLYTGATASTEVLRTEGPGRRIIHLAAHGTFRRDNPIFSAIELAGAPLSLLDLHRLHLPCELVVLSGCGTGLSVVEDGDELLGLASGVLSAGARSAVVTLWDVDDQSGVELMSAFYRELAAGTDKANALRRAMVESMSAGPHPYLWAPFMLVGDPRPCVRGGEGAQPEAWNR